MTITLYDDLEINKIHELRFVKETKLLVELVRY